MEPTRPHSGRAPSKDAHDRASWGQNTAYAIAVLGYAELHGQMSFLAQDRQALYGERRDDYSG